MGTSLHSLCLHLAIIICLSVSLSGNTVTPNTTILDSTSLPESQDTSTTKSTTLSDTTSSVTETSSITKLMEEAKEKATKPLVFTDATKLSSETETSTASSSKSSSTTSTSTTSTSSKSPTTLSTSNATHPNTTPSATTSASSTPTTASTTTTPIKAITNGAGINAIKVHGKKKRLSLADIASTPTTTTITDKPTSSRPNRKTGKKKKKRRPSRQPKKQKGFSQTTTRTHDGTSKKTHAPASVTPKPLTTAYPLSPDATIHKVEAGVEPVLFAAVAADNKKNGGGKKGGKKGAKKNGKAHGKKGDTGPPGPKGPKGAKGEPGDAAESSMKMQAASSAVLTEHFGPDKDVIVPFDLKLIDLADNYDNTTGVFICTIPGVYVVSLYLMSHPGAKVNARVFINSRPIAALWADDSKNSGFYPSSSIQTVSRLAFGDQVYVMLVDGGYGESWVHANYNAFSLFLLYEDVFFSK